MIPTVTWKEAQELVLAQEKDWHIVRIDAQFDIDHYRDITAKIVEEKEFIEKDFYKTYTAIGLQYDDEENPYYDSVMMTASQSGRVYNKEPSVFYKFNDLGSRYKDYFSRIKFEFNKCNIFRSRILVSKPLHLHAQHIDERGCRLHFPITTNRHAIMWFGDDPYHMRADGSVYVCNTGRVRHNFGNLQRKEDRIHLVSGLASPEWKTNL